MRLSSSGRAPRTPAPAGPYNRRVRLQLVGAAGGAVFAMLTLAAFALNTGPSSGDGVTVVEAFLRDGSVIKIGGTTLAIAPADALTVRLPLSERDQLGGLAGFRSRCLVVWGGLFRS